MISLVLVVTTQCNLDCRHCLRGDVEARHLSVSVIEKVLQGAEKYGITTIQATGGEPFLYRNITDLFELADHHRIPLTFSSNGLLLQNHSEFLLKYRKNIRLINISLDGHAASIHERVKGSGTFQKVLESFKFLRKEGIPFGVITCLSHYNRKHIKDIARFAKKQGARQIIFTTVLPCANARKNGLILDETARETIHRELVRIARISSLDFFKIFYCPVYVGEPIMASRNVVMCRNQRMRYVTVDVDAKLHFCCFLTQYGLSEDVEKNLKIVSLQDVSFDEGFKSFFERMQGFLKTRIEDYQSNAETGRWDFNSCFYCSRKLGL